MVNKMKLLPSLLKNTRPGSSSSSWSWPSCHQPRTLSFRAHHHNHIFKTINSAFVDDATLQQEAPHQSLFANSDDDDDDDDSTAGDPIETVVRGLRSDRLFFEPDETSSILEAKAAAAATTLTFKDGLVLSMESRDPYLDFRKSMEEMVEAHGVKDWETLEELLCWYLRVNAKTNHAYIIAAFVDLLFASASSSSSSISNSSSHSPSSPLSFYTSSPSSSFSTPCASCLQAQEEVDATPGSSILLEQVKQQIKHEEEPSSSSV